MLALKPALERLGVRVLVNSGSPKINIHLFNSAWFKHDLFTPDTFTRQDCRVLHRIDGPVGIYRGTDNREDERIFDLNRHYAAATIFQSGYCFNASIELGYHPVNPVVIHNAVNSRIFYPSAHYKNISDRRIRLISSAWSDNPRKGGPLMKWLDENLDFSKYEYTFVGRTKESFHNIRHIEAQSSQKLAKLLRNHDIFISPSHHEPCSNALLEAMSCGLPVLYMNDGGNPELVGQGGLPFNTTDDIMPKLGQLAEKIEAFRNMIFVDSIESVARRYIEVAQVALDSLPPSIT
jgi:glycosyltransferase involved in cell wall biosynthesis